MPKKFTISGNVGLPGVKMQGFPGTVETDDSGAYTAQVTFGWSGTVTPIKGGYTFEPASKKYPPVKADISDEKYVANVVKYTISGSVGIPGVKMTGLPDEPNSGPDGRYSATVPYGFNNVVTPEKAGYTFDPPSKAFEPIQANQTFSFKSSEITFIISGTVSCSLGDANGIVLKGLPGDPKLTGKGAYSVKVRYGWTGKVVPQREGCKFSPESVDYPAVMTDCTDQDYTATVDEFTLAGTVGVTDVVLKGLPNDPTSTADGSFSVRVPYGFEGKVTPTLKGYTFNPASLPISKTTADRSGLIFGASIIKLTIAGTISGPPAAIGGVKMDGLPGEVVTNAQGAYTAQVDFGFSGIVTPTKEGVTFTDSSRTYSAIETNQTRETYKATPVTYTVSGNVMQAGVQVQFSGGKMVTSEADGSYKIEMPYHWKGTITPRKAGYTFDPPSATCEELTAAQSQDFQASVITYTMSGKVSGGEAGPVAEASITVEPDGIVTKTDAEGQYRFPVPHGWKGSIVVSKDGVVFTVNTLKVETPVVRDMSNLNFTGKARMITITKKVLSPDGQPIEGVTITAKPGIGKAVSNAQGKYTISVPYGWTGELTATKEGWDFGEPVKYDVALGADIDETGESKAAVTPPQIDEQPKPPVPGPKPPVDNQGKSPVDQTKVTPIPPKPIDQSKTPIPGSKTPADPERERVLQLLKELGIDTTKLGGPNAGEGGAASGGRTVLLLDAINQFVVRTGAKVAVDATVKNVPVAATDITTLPGLLNGTPYKMKPLGDKTLVYKSITNNFSGEDLSAALTTLSELAEVPITMDDKVAGQVNINLVDATLEQALERLLSASPFGWEKVVDKNGEVYYSVASTSIKDPGFSRLSVHQALYLNTISPTRVAELMPVPYQDYVKGGTDPNSHWVTVTAPRDIAERIIGQIKSLDRSLRQVLLTARVVSMEKGTNLNVGVEWQTPRASIGAFTDSFVKNADSVSTSTWPYGIQVGYAPDRTFTDALTAQLNLLQREGRAEIVSSPQVMASDGERSEIRDIQEEWYMMTATTAGAFMYTQSELQKIESGTILTITPKIGDDNDIRLQMAVEVSDSTPQGTSSGLPVVTRRQAKSFVRIPDGGTAAVSGLTENRSKSLNRKMPFFGDLPLIGGLFRNNSEDKTSREIAVFVTANIAPEGGSLTTAGPEDTFGQAAPAPAPAAGGSFNDQLQQELAGQSR